MILRKRLKPMFVKETIPLSIAVYLTHIFKMDIELGS